MNKTLILPLIALFALTGCTSSNTSTNTSYSSEDVGSDYDYNDPISVTDPSDVSVSEATSEFSIVTEDGEYSISGNIYKITKAGTYSLTGKLDGQILIEAGEEDEVVLELNNVTINYGTDSPIKATSCGKLEISAKKDTGNIVNDNRSAKVTDDTSKGEGAINAKCDLKLKGSGSLVVTGNYNNAVHSTKDLTVQKLTLKATGYNNALKGKNSVTITSGEVQAYAKNGNGIKTDESDLTSSNKQKGTIAINGGLVYVDSLRDAIDASYNVEISQLDEEVATEVSIKTGTYSSNYNRSTFKADSEKGIKAANEIIVNKGTIVISASDDAVHANYGDTLGTGAKGQGNITVNNGLIQVASGDDGLHADNTLNINGGKVVITNATEGFEGNYININGGYSYIYGSDDGVNCSKKSFSSCAFKMTGGYLDVAVKNGDTDGIDSNGNFTLSGGTIITRGSPGTQSGMSTGLDVDGTCSMTGGTLIAFNGLETKPTTSGTIYSAMTSNASQGGGGFGPGGGGHGGREIATTSSIQAGDFVLSGDGLEVSFTNDYIYASFLVYSSSLKSGSTYTLTRNNSTLFTWTQQSSSTTISF